jgi:hypothetical protein
MQARLQEIIDRVDEATVGPWVAFSSEICVEKEQSAGLRYPVVASMIGNREQWFNRSDATFIAHARQDIPFLLAALQEAQQREDQLIHQAEVNAREMERSLQESQAEIHSLRNSIACVRDANNAWQKLTQGLREEIKKLKSV